METQLQQGVERLSQIFGSRRILKLSDPEPIHGRLAFFFVAKAYGKEWLFTLSHEVLSDLPGMKSYQAAADRFARSLEKRFRNKSPDLFFCVSGAPVQIQIDWPLQPLANRAASYMRVGISDTRDGRVAACFVVITHQQSVFDLKEDPFLIQESIINSVRLAIDANYIKFYPREALPNELQSVNLTTNPSICLTSEAIDRFLQEKVICLAFRGGDAANTVWISDPWDGTYLGTSPGELKRSAQVLDAQSRLRLDDSQEFASIGRELLANLRDFEKPGRMIKSRVPGTKEQHSWDVFISHASEDKDSFVRPLANALRERGVTVWFDEYALKVGDSLTRSIDQGLARCRFGIGVLSPAFFAKEWTQKELGGLVSRESAGQKIILPIWHNLTANELRNYSPMLADRFAVSSSEGLTRVVDEIVSVLDHSTP